MPTSVPSVVRDTIREMFPNVETGGQLVLSYGHEQAVAGIVAMVDQIPDNLLTLEPRQFARFLAAKEVLRTAVNFWQAHGSSGAPVTKIPGLGSLSPMKIVYDALGKCRDEPMAKDPDTLRFVTDLELRQSLLVDLGAIERAISNAEWKGATVIAGSVVEALLLWGLLERCDPDRVQDAIAAAVSAKDLPRRPPEDLTKWDLGALVPVAGHASLITGDTRKQCDLARRFRDFIHPGRERRLAMVCDRGTALTAEAAVEAVVRDLRRLPQKEV